MTDEERKAILEEAEYAYDKEAEWMQSPPCNPRALEAALDAAKVFRPANVMTDTEKAAVIEKAADAACIQWSEAEAALDAVGFFDRPAQGGGEPMTDTASLREAILDAFDVVRSAPDTPRTASEEADRIIEIATAPGLHLAATLRKMLNPPSTLPTPQQIELWAAIEAVEKLTK